MSIQDLGAIGEFVAAVAVVISLVYLALQVKQTRQISKAVALQAIQRDVLDLVLADPEEIGFYLAIHGKQDRGEQLTPIEREYVSQRSIRAMRIHENRWYQHRSGLLDDELFHAYRRNK